MMMKAIQEKYGDRVEINVYEGVNDRVKEYGIETLPAIVMDEDIRIIGVAPSMQTLEDALKEGGLFE